MTILLWPIIFTVIRINVQATVCAGQILDQNVEEAIIFVCEADLEVLMLFVRPFVFSNVENDRMMGTLDDQMTE